ncbi:MAG: leucine-rich repeat domain-containing protein [Bacteroidetes bacterium]|nr:MAG: leucine-rich repeat domain-containing protein [Bacteroidota bacterium]
MKHIAVYILTLLALMNDVLAQNTKLYSIIELKSKKTFTKIEEIKKNPDNVIVLDLGDEKLKELPKEIELCKNLQKLVIYGNELKKLPDFLGNLKNLRYIDVYNNQLTDLPANFSNLTHLLYIDLGNNRFKNIPEVIFELKNITHLYIYGNRLKNIDEKIGNLKQLEELRIGKGLKVLSGGNRIKKLPESITQLTQLKELHAPDTRLRELPKGFENLKKLEWLEFANVSFLKMPDVLAELPNLRYVSFFDNFNKKEKENLAEKKPKLTTLYDKNYEGNFWAWQVAVKQGKFTDVELGIAKAFKKDFITLAMSFSGLYQIQNQRAGTQIGVQANSLISVGLYGGAWLGNQNTNFFFRPQIGFGKGNLSLTYNYDWTFGKETQNFNTHSIRICALIPFKPRFSIF